ncbi:MAG: amino acid adenylation domain-containing protein [Polyangiales bacterium]
MLRGLAERAPEQVFLTFHEDAGDRQVSLTYGALDRRARAVASLLQQSDATRRPVLLLHPPGIAYVEALFGCFYAGAIAVPGYPPRASRALPRLRSLIADSQAIVALTTRALLEKTQLSRVRDAELSKLTWLASDEAEDGPVALPTPASDAIAVLQYTSGSTSNPKGVMLSHANLLSNVAALAERTELTSSHHMVSWLPPYHDMGLIAGILMPLCAGAGLTLMSPSAFLERPLRWLEAISTTRAFISGAPNFAYELCARRVTPEQFAKLDLSSWQVAFCGAERIRADTVQRFADAAAPAGYAPRAFAPCYGLAEATVGVTLQRRERAVGIERIADAALARGEATPATPDERGRTLVGCGQVLRETELIIVDPERRTPLPARSIGEIWVRGPGVSGGYWNAPAASQRVFRARLDVAGTQPVDYLRTGDLGYLSGDELFVTGRIKDLMVLRGQNHYPEDVEITAQVAHRALRPGCGVAFAIEGDAHESLVIVHEMDPAAEADASQIITAVQAVIAQDHELPVADVVLVRPGTIPKTSSGKLQRARTRAMYLEGALARLGDIVGDAPALPVAADALTGQIASIMGELLGLDQVGPDADFLWLGGHSLQATQLLSRLSERFGVELTLQQLFEAPTPRKLAARVELALSAGTPREPVPELVPLDRAHDELPLSFSQERMWFLHQLDPEGSAYNVAGAVRVDGPLVLEAMARAFAGVVAHHEALRTNFVSVDGAPKLVIHEARDLPVPVVDVSHLPDPLGAATEAASEVAAQPFDVARDLLIRAALYKLASERHVLVVSMHHLITDAWSMGILVHDLMEHYDAALRGRPRARDDAPLRYVDYAAWQRKLLGPERLARELSFWKSRLTGAQPLLLPTDFPRGRGRKSVGALEPLAISPALREQLRELGQRHGATLFMVLLAAFEVVLQRHSGQTDVVVGVPVANRMRSASEAFIGTLVNTLAVRAEVTPELSFAGLLAHVRERALEAFDHQNLPFERLVSELGVERRAGSSPLVQVMFDYQNVPMAFRSGDLQLNTVVLSRGAAQFELSLLYHDTELGASGGIEYSTELFEPAHIRRFAQHFVRVLEAAVADPTLPLGKIDLLSDDERATVLSFAGEAAAHAPGPSLPEQLARQAATRPDVRAVSDAHGMLTYRELNQRVELLAQRLTEAGAGPGERVGVYLERSKEIVVAMLAVLRAGAAYVPLDPRHPTSRIHYVLEDAAPRILITDAVARTSLPDALAGAQILVLSAAVEHATTPARALLDPGPDAAAYVIYTSGSTGRPKGVEISRGALENFLASMKREPGLSPKDRVLSTTTLAFDIAELELLLPVITGASVHVAPADAVADAEALAALVERISPTMMQATPATWRMLIEAGFEGNRSLTVLCGGEALSRELADQLLSRSCAVWNMYGPTETTVWSLVHRVERTSDVPIGRPIDRTRVYTVDAHGALCPLGVAGEICIGGAGVATGYYQRPDLTRERFVPDPFSPLPGARMYRTGDLGRLRPDGVFEHLGRLDFQIKIRGFRIEPGEIEAVLKEDPRVRQALVIAREDRRDDVRLVAYYVVDEGAPGAGIDLREQLRRRLPDYMIPSAFVPMVELPRTPNGKIDRAALPAPDVSHVALGPERIAPRDKLEASLARVWEEVLGTREPGVRDSFFALGGHSLLAVRMFARVQREHGVDLPLATLFEAPTIEYLAERIRAQRLAGPSMEAPEAPPPPPPTPTAQGPFSYLVPVHTEGTRRPLFCVHGAGGNVVGFAALASHLGVDRPFYALQARGVDGVAEPFAHIEEAAAAYLRELRIVQPRGPYHLAGYCGGGTIAFEMARMLREAGETVGLVAMLDTYRPGVSIGRSRAAQLALNWSRHGTRFVARRIVNRLRSDAEVRGNQARITYHQLRGRAVPHELRDHWLTLAFFDAVAQYRPRPYRGKLTILRAVQVDAALASVGRELGWSGLATEGIEVFDVPGSHDTLIDEPNAGVLGTTLRLCLEQAEARAETHGESAPPPAT